MEQQQMNLNVSLDKTTAMSCNKCGSQVFQEGVMLRKASRLLTGTAQDALIPIQIFACMQCGSVNEEFLPSILRQQAQTQQPEIVDVVEETTEDTGAKIIKF